MPDELIYGVIYSEFDDVVGPTARYFVPPSILNKDFGATVAARSIDIIHREDLSNQSSLAVISFLAKNKKGLSICFEWQDDNKRARTGTGSITVLFEEKLDMVFYKYMKDIEILLQDTIEQIIEIKTKKGSMDDIFILIKQLHEDTREKLSKLSSQEMGPPEGSEAFPSEDIGEKYQFKIVICGDPACGKTSTVLRFTDKAFRVTYLPTLGANITEKVIKIDNTTIVLSLWDIAGQAKFQILRRQFYSGAQAIVLIFDLTRKNTFDSIPKWHEDLVNSLNKRDLITILCGNKNDLEDKRMVSRAQGDKLAKQYNMEYLETSALTGENINETFYKIARKVVFDRV